MIEKSLPFQAASLQTFDEAALEEQEHDYDRENDDQASGAGKSPVAMEGLLEGEEARGDGHKRVVLDKGDGIDEFVPGCEAHDEADGEETR